MIPRKLVSQIQDNADKLAADLVQAVKHDLRGKAYHDLPDECFKELLLDLYKNLGAWLHRRSWSNLRNVYEKIGRRRFHDGMPLNNVVFSFTLTKTMLLDYVRGAVQGDGSERDMELELVLALSQFFDKVIYHIVTGYEDARCASEIQAEPAESARIEERIELAAASAGKTPSHEEVEDMSLSRGGQVGETSG